ncbi:MAG: leucine-rich repeat protein [Oscillospiraceae bacterium]|nr:leucine-rich repeat protein [Oscillospiraceae bacterium]
MIKSVKKRVMSLFLATVIAIGFISGGMLSASAADSGDGWSLDDDGVLVIENDVGMTDWVDNGRGTTSNIYAVREVVIQDGVTFIEGNAFSNCTGLSEITISDTVKNIGMWAFFNCLSLTEITIPGGVESIGIYVFSNCTGLTNVTIGVGVGSIGFSAFQDCTKLTEIKIPDSVTSIGSSAFSGTALFNNQPDGVVYVGKWAVGYKGEMPTNTTITLRNDTRAIGSGAFASLSNLTSIIILDSVISIGSGAFSDCTGLTSVSIGGGTKSIGEGAFMGCTSLTEIIIPKGATSVESFAFFNCINLREIKIPNSITTIGSSAFYCCVELKSVTFKSQMPPFFALWSVFGNVPSSMTVYVPIGAKAAYEAESELSGFNIVEVDFDDDVEPVVVSVGKVSTSSGVGVVSVPVTVEYNDIVDNSSGGNPGINSAVLYFDIPAGLKLTGFSDVGGMRIGDSFIGNSSGYSRVVLSAEGLGSYSGELLVTLELEVLDNAPVDVLQEISIVANLSSVSDINAKTLDVEYVSGGVTLVEIIQPPVFIRGDCNQDGKIDVADITYLKRVLVMAPGFSVNDECDINADGRINAADLTFLKGFIMRHPGFVIGA